ncbi:MAG: response regulator [Thermodesulfobacteriota bacterium]
MTEIVGAAGSEKSSRPMILLMEDELGVAEGLQMVLKEEGYGVDLAMTGRSALERMNKGKVDLLVADLRLPDMDGLEVIRQVKKRKPETEVVIITGYPSVQSVVESAKMGVREYLRKPFTEDELKAAVGEALKKKVEASLDQFLTETKEGRLVQKREVLRVLDRTTLDHDFWNDLMNNGSEALEGYQLSWAAKAAIVSGDLKWINEHVGELTQKQLMFIFKRLEREAW